MQKKTINRIFLTGFMCSGKSTIGRILANTIGFDFYDCDKVIELETKNSISKIFEEHGEEYFRNLEHITLKKLCEYDKVVISLGGGTIVNEVNRALISESGLLVYLKLNQDKLYQRLKNKIDRPMFQTLDEYPLPKETAMDKIKNMLDSREIYYADAEIIFEPGNKSIGKTVDSLANLLKKRYIIA